MFDWWSACSLSILYIGEDLGGCMMIVRVGPLY